MSALKISNLGLALLVELAALAAIVAVPLTMTAPAPARWLGAVLAGGLICVAWGRWAAPKASRRLSLAPLLAFKSAVFGMAVAALVLTGQGGLAAILAAACVVHLALALVFKQV